MLKLLVSLLFMAIILSLPACQKGELFQDGNAPIKGVETPKPGSLLQGGEILRGIPGSTVWAMAFDKDNVLWMSVGTAFNGAVAYYDNRCQVFDRYNTRIPHADITQVFVDKTNKKWFGNSWGDVFTYDNQRWEVLPRPNLTSGTEGITDIAQDREGNVWVLGKSALWDYKNGKLDKVFSVGSAAGLAIDSDNNIWLGTRAGLYRVSGEKLESLRDMVPSPYIVALCADKTGNLYVATQSGYFDTKDGRTYAEGGLYTLKNGRLELVATEKTGLPSLNIRIMSVDSHGDLWLGYQNRSMAAARFDGNQWTSFGPGTPIDRWQVSEILDANGLIWLSGSPWNREQSPLAVFDGKIWVISAFPALEQDPRIWWQQEDIVELYKYPVADTDIHEILSDPIPYRGKKIRITGKIERGFEYANFADTQGKKLNIWPETHGELTQFLKDKGIDAVIRKSENMEFIGYLEFGSRYGHMGGWPYRFLITEVYPYSNDMQQNDSYRRLFEQYIATLAQDKRDVRAVIAKWVSAMKTGNIEELTKLYYPDGTRYKSLLEKSSQEYLKKNTMDITINSMSIKVQGANARVNILDATIKPDRYFTPIGNVQVKGDSLYKLRSVDFVKDGERWEISDYDYSPEYVTPSIPEPIEPPATP